MIDAKGSVWRKWDLHIHTPASLIANDYGGDTPEAWEAFIAGIEEMSSDIKVIGINDYLFIDGYKKVLEYKKSGRLKNIELILPVIEFRLREFVGSEKLKRINYHVIFADESIIKPDVIEAQFLSGLRGKVNLDPEIAETVSWAATVSKESLTDLGGKIINSIPDDRRPGGIGHVQMGFDNINFDLADIQDLLGEGSKPNTYLKDNYLKAIGKSEWESFRWETAIADKKTAINSAHIVFSASPDSAQALRSKEQLTIQSVNDRLLHCSDAHMLRSDMDITITKPKELGHCFTWIKADPTFEGLKQILYEPGRIHLGDTKPVEPTNTIDNFSISLPKSAKISVLQNDGKYKDEKFCFADANGTYELSPYFNCLVGGRGTGKSTILNFLGLHSNEANSSHSFWKNLNPSFDPADDAIFSFDGVQQFEFIGQSEVESFAVNKELFTAAIYRRANILSDGLLSASEIRLTESLEDLHDYENIVIDLANLEMEMQVQSALRETLQKSIKITESKEYSEIVENLTNDSNDLQELESWRDIVDSYRLSIEEIHSQYNADEEEVDDDVDVLPETELSDLYRKAFAEAQENIEKAVTALDGSNFEVLIEKERVLSTRIEKNEEKLSILLIKAGLSEENILQVKRAPQKLVQINDTIAKLQKRIDDKRRGLGGYSETLMKIEAEKIIFETEIRDAIKPLNDALKEQAVANEYKDIKEIGLEYYLDIKAVWAAIADELYSTFYQEYKNGERSDYVKEFIETQTTEFSATHAEITALISSKLKKNPNSGYLKFLSEVFSTSTNFEVFRTIRDRTLNDIGKYRRIQVTYNGKGIEYASFGQKCTAVVVILMLFGNYPLIIDEPEAHLDGSLIANYLVPLIKRTKKNRQIIFATHNANFVVNGDAEKIIILKNDGKTEFIETTIENELYRSDLLKLEGGKEAFKKRSDKLKIL